MIPYYGLYENGVVTFQFDLPEVAGPARVLVIFDAPTDPEEEGFEVFEDDLFPEEVPR